MRFVLYCRTSTSLQEREQTIESQLWALRKHAKEQGYTIVKEYLDDGWSGELLARPFLDQLRDDAKLKLFEAALMVDLDRVSRKFSHQALILDELEELGIQVMSLSQPKAETPEDKVLLGFRGIFAEYERVKIAERTRRGKLRKASEGVLFGWNAPYGYRYTNNPHPRFEIVDEEADVVRKIYHWVSNEDMTIRAVIRRLNELKIYPRKKRRAIWTTSTLSRLLRNEVYVGIEYYNKNYAVVPQNPKLNGKYKKVKKSSRKLRPKKEWLPIKVPATLDKKLFDEVQEKLKANKFFAARNRKRQYLLAGLVYCSCSRKRIGEGVKDHVYYRCTDRIYSFPLPRQCFIKGVNAANLDNLVWNGVAKMLTNPKLVREQAEKYLKSQSDSRTISEYEAGQTNKKISKLKDEESRYLKAYGADLMTFGQLKEETTVVRRKIDELQSRMKSIEEKPQVSSIDLSNVDVLVEKVKQVIKSYEPEKKQLLLRSLLNKVIVESQTKAVVKGYIPLDTQVRKVGLCAESRDSRFAKLGKKYAI